MISNNLRFVNNFFKKIFKFFILSDFIRLYAKSPRHPV